MRIVIAAPPKAGNVWLKCLLANLYGLRWLDDRQVPRDGVDGFARWAVGGKFPDRAIFHRHYKYSPAFLDAAEAAGVRVVTIVRDPYDVFVSWYHHMQLFSEQFAADDPRRVVVGKPIGHPDVLAYLGDHFGSRLAMANDWVRSGRSVVVRYEDLHAAPVAALGRAAEQLGLPVTAAAIERAVAACRPDRMRRMDQVRQEHVRTAVAGDWANHLTEAHLAVFRARHAAAIRALGYEVR